MDGSKQPSNGMRLVAAEAIPIGAVVIVNSDGLVFKKADGSSWRIKNVFESKGPQKFDFDRCIIPEPGKFQLMPDSQYCGTVGAAPPAVNGCAKSQIETPFVVASEPRLSIGYVGETSVVLQLNVAIPVEGCYQTHKSHFTSLSTTVEQLEAMLKYVKKEQAKVKQQIKQAHDNAIQQVENDLKRMKDARKAEASKA